MSTLHKIKTLLTRLFVKSPPCQWHAKCELCSWEVHNLDYRHFAMRRAEMHFRNAHAGPFDGANWDCYMRVYYSQAHEVFWNNRA